MKTGGVGRFTRYLEAAVRKHVRRLSESRKVESSADRVESVHELRVASRRLRAFGDVFEPLVDRKSRRRVDRRLRRIARAARSLRDWDVVAARLRSLNESAKGDLERAGIDLLLGHADAGREKQFRKFARRSKEIRVKAIERALSAQLESIRGRWSTERDAREFAAATLAGLVSEVVVALPARGGVEDPEALHELRIRLKKARYALELFEPLLGTAGAPLLSEARRLQDLLGDHHDLVVLRELAREKRLELEKRRLGTLARGVEALEERLVARRRAVFEEFGKTGFQEAWWRDQVERALVGKEREALVN